MVALCAALLVAAGSLIVSWLLQQVIDLVSGYDTGFTLTELSKHRRKYWICNSVSLLIGDFRYDFITWHKFSYLLKNWYVKCLEPERWGNEYGEPVGRLGMRIGGRGPAFLVLLKMIFEKWKNLKFRKWEEATFYLRALSVFIT